MSCEPSSFIAVHRHRMAMFPVDLLNHVSHKELEESAADYMSRLLSNIPETLEQIAVSISSKVCVDLSSVGFVPLYGSNDLHRILALFSPTDPFAVIALYLLDQWWTVEDILRTGDLSRDGALKVETAVERIVLYVLNRVIYRGREMNSKEELPFLCHGESDFAKICWSNGEAVGFYSVKPTGSLCKPPFGRSYQLPVMDSIFVRKLHRRKGLGLKMLEDFVLSFSEEHLGLRYPLTQFMYRVCEKHLRQYPEDSCLLWEVEGAGEWTQRSNISSRIHSMNLSAVTRNLLSDLSDESSRSRSVPEQTDDTAAVMCSCETKEEKTVVKTNNVVVTTVSVCKKTMGSEVTEETSEKVIRIERIEAESSKEQVCVEQCGANKMISTASGGEGEDGEEALALQSDADFKGNLPASLEEEEDNLASDGPQNQDNIMVVISEEVHEKSENVDEVDETSGPILSDARTTDVISLETIKDQSADAGLLLSDESKASVGGDVEAAPVAVLRSSRRKSQQSEGQRQDEETQAKDLVRPGADSTSGEELPLEPKKLDLADFPRVSVVLVDLKIQQDIRPGGEEAALNESGADQRPGDEEAGEVMLQEKDGEDQRMAEETAGTESPRRVDEHLGGVDEEQLEEPGEAQVQDHETELETLKGSAGSGSYLIEGTCISEEAEEVLNEESDTQDMPEASPVSVSACVEESSFPDEKRLYMGRTVNVVLMDLKMQPSEAVETIEKVSDGSTSETEQIQRLTEETGDVEVPLEEHLRSSGKIANELGGSSSEEAGVQEQVLRNVRRYNLRTLERKSYRQQTEEEDQRVISDEETEVDVEEDAGMEIQEVDSLEEPASTSEKLVPSEEDLAEELSVAGQAEEEEAMVLRSGKKVEERDETEGDATQTHEEEESEEQFSQAIFKVSVQKVVVEETPFVTRRRRRGGRTKGSSAEKLVQENGAESEGSDSKKLNRQVEVEEAMDTVETQEVAGDVNPEKQESTSVEADGEELEIKAGEAEVSGRSAEETGSEPVTTDERGDDETLDIDAQSGGRTNESEPGQNSGSLEDVSHDDPGSAEEPLAESATEKLAPAAVMERDDAEMTAAHENDEETEEPVVTEETVEGLDPEMENQHLHEVCGAQPLQEVTPEESLAEEQAPETPAEAEPLGQQVNEMLDDKVAAEEVKDTAEEPEEATAVSTRVLRSGKKIRGTAVSRRASKRARRHLDTEGEDEAGTDEKTPADTSSQKVSGVQEEDTLNKECDADMEEEHGEPAIQGNEVEEPSVSTIEMEDMALIDEPEEPQTGDDDLHEEEETPVMVTRVLRSRGKTIRSAPRTRSTKSRTAEDLGQETADEELQEGGSPQQVQHQENLEEAQVSKSVEDNVDGEEDSTGVRSAEWNDVTMEESQVIVAQNSSVKEGNAALQAKDESDDQTPSPAVEEQREGPSQELDEDGVEPQQMIETPLETLMEELMSDEVVSQGDDGTVVSTTKASESEEEPSLEDASNEPESKTNRKSRQKKRKSSYKTPRRKSTRGKQRLSEDEEEKEALSGDVEVPEEAVVYRDVAAEDCGAATQAPDGLEHEGGKSFEVQENKMAEEQIEINTEETEETEEIQEVLEPEIELVLHEEHDVCDVDSLQEKTAEDQSHGGSLVEEQVTEIPDGPESMSQQVDDMLDDKVGADEVTETAEEPEEATAVSTRVLRSGKKTRRTAVSRSDDGSDAEKSPDQTEREVHPRVLRKHRRSTGPRRASKRARRHPSVEGEDEGEVTDEKTPAEASPQEVSGDQEEDTLDKEFDVDLGEEHREPSEETNEAQEPAASSNEEPEEPQARDEDCPEVEESLVMVTRVLRSGGRTPRRKSTRAKHQLSEDEEEKEGMNGDAEVPGGAVVDRVDIEEEVNEAAPQAPDDSEHNEKLTSLESGEETEEPEVTHETLEDLEPEMETIEDNLTELPSQILEEESPEKEDYVEEQTLGSEKQMDGDERQSESEEEQLLVIGERRLRGRVVPSVVLSPSAKFRAEEEEKSPGRRSAKRSPSSRRSGRKRKSSGSPPVRPKRHGRVGD